MKELSKDELLTWLGKEDDFKAVNPLFDEKFNKKAREQIHRLIEHQFDVSFYGDRFTRWDEPR